jgi:hypothetical protein
MAFRRRDDNKNYWRGFDGSGLRIDADWDRMARQVLGGRFRVLYVHACSDVLMPLSSSDHNFENGMHGGGAGQ